MRHTFCMILFVFILMFTVLSGGNQVSLAASSETSSSQSDSSLTFDTDRIPFPTLDGDTFSILFVGNSFIFTGDVPQQVSNLSKMYGIDLHCESICPGGATLADTKNEAIEDMQKNNYDIVVFQDYGTRPVSDEEVFQADVKDLCDEAKRNGSIPVLYNPAWANDQERPDREYQELETAVYEKAARANGAILVNAGDAWVYAYQKFPDISLYAQGDYHANEAGAYYTACVFASTLFDLHIKDICEGNLYYGDKALELGQAAWEYVTYYKENQCYPTEIVSVLPGTNEKSLR